MYVLDALWRGDISPNEKYTRKGGEYHKLLLQLCEEEDHLMKELTEKGKTHFEAFRNTYIDMTLVSEREVFIEAFRLGARIVLDIVGEHRGTFSSVAED